MHPGVKRSARRLGKRRRAESGSCGGRLLAPEHDPQAHAQGRYRADGGHAGEGPPFPGPEIGKQVMRDYPSETARTTGERSKAIIGDDLACRFAGVNGKILRHPLRQRIREHFHRMEPLETGNRLIA